MTANGHERAKPLRTGDPHELGDYQLMGRLGRGGMGTVYLAKDANDRTVALKLIHPDLSDDEDFRRRFTREVESARRVARFSTAGVIDAKLTGDPLYIISEYVAGPTLSEAITENGPMGGGTLEGLAMGVAAALAAIHGAGVIHRDLKPANVLLSSVGPKVIDFGIARALDDQSAVTRSSQLMGTPAYLAPELILGQDISPASDIFSWGCLVAFAGTGSAPFDAPTVPAVLHQISTEAPNLGGLDATLDSLVRQALNKDPQQRPTAQQLLNTLVGHEEASVAEVDRTVVQSWTPPSTQRPAEDAAESDSMNGTNETFGLTAAGSEQLPRTQAYDNPSPAGGTLPYAPTQPPQARPAGPQYPPGQGPPYGPGPGAPSPQSQSYPGQPPYGPPAGPQYPPYGGQPNPQSPPYGQAAYGGPEPYGPPNQFGGPGGRPPGGGVSPASGGGAAKKPRRNLVIIGAAAVAVAVFAVAVVVATRFMGSDPPPVGTPIFNDNYSSTETGWYSSEYLPDDSAYYEGYYKGQYAVRSGPDQQMTSSYVPYEEDLPDSYLVSAAAKVDQSDPNGQYGLICMRSEDDDYERYDLLLRSDGSGAELRRVTGESGNATLHSVEEVPGFTAEGTNTLHAACQQIERDGETVNRIRFWVNEELVFDTIDENPIAPSGDAGIVTWYGSTGKDTVVFFDDFAISTVSSGEA